MNFKAFAQVSSYMHVVAIYKYDAYAVAYMYMLAAAITYYFPPNRFIFIRIYSVKRGDAGFALQDIKVSHSIEEARAIVKTPGYFLVKDFTSLGISDVCLFAINRQPEDESKVFRLNVIETYDWCDDRLLRTMKSFNLSDSDVLKFNSIYENLLFGRSKVLVLELMKEIDFPYNEIARWVVDSVQPENPKELTFSEYVFFVCYFVMFSPKDLARFLFQCADHDGNNFLDREEFHDLVTLLHGKSPFALLSWKLAYNDFYDKKLNHLFIKQFVEFTYNYPGVLWQPQLLQEKLRAFNLGKAYWAEKMEQYRVIREDMGIKLL